MGAREKYKANPPRSRTTFVTFGSFSSEASWMRRYNVVICSERSAAKGATSSPIAAGLISGSSPCTLTMMSESSVAATSARRSVPVSCVAFVSRTLPPKSLTRVAMRRSSVATMTCETTGDADARRYTCSIIGRPSMSARALPGSRVDAYLAGMTATMLSGGTESTFEPVDAGCTTNNSTPAKCSCYDPGRPEEDVKKSRQRKGRQDRKEESFEKMLCALCDLCVQRDSFTSSLAERSVDGANHDRSSCHGRSIQSDQSGVHQRREYSVEVHLRRGSAESVTRACMEGRAGGCEVVRPHHARPRRADAGRLHALGAVRHSRGDEGTARRISAGVSWRIGQQRIPSRRLWRPVPTERVASLSLRPLRARRARARSAGRCDEG